MEYQIALKVLFGIMCCLAPPFLNYISIKWDGRLPAAYPPVYGTCEMPKRSKWHPKLPTSVYGIVVLLRHQRNGGTVIWRYVIGEYVAALLMALAVWKIGWEWELAVAVWLTAILIIIVQTDLTDMIIPNKVVVVGVLGAAALRAVSHPLPWHEYAVGAVAGSGALLFIAVTGEKLLRKEVMGGGDIKLYILVGIVLGWKLALVSLFLASAAGFVGGMASIALGGFGLRSRTIPFGPYIAIGTLLAYYWGEELLGWYLSLLAV